MLKFLSLVATGLSNDPSSADICVLLVAYVDTICKDWHFFQDSFQKLKCYFTLRCLNKCSTFVSKGMWYSEQC